MQRICGFMVVRKPEFATNKQSRPNLRLGEKGYRGVDRLPWENLKAAYYGHNLPTSLIQVWEEFNRLNRDLSGIEVLKSYDQAKEIVALLDSKSEIIAIWSPELEVLKNSVETEVSLKYLGLDCLAKSSGVPITVEWSVLLSGIFARPDCFASYVDRLNDHGLLLSEEDCETIFR